MTCIVGFTDGTTVTIGGDSAGVADHALSVRADEKVFENGDFVFGFTSSFRMGQLLRYSFTPPYHEPRVDVDKYMRTAFVDAIRNCFKQGGFAGKDNERESAGIFLVGYRGRIFHVEGDYQVGERIVPYDAVGCGRDIALGALSVMVDPGRVLEADALVRNALAVAEKFSGWVRGPFKVVTK